MRTLFIADLHLGPDTPALNALFTAFLQRHRGQCAALYILGDLFEYWIGDDDLTPLNCQLIAEMGKFAYHTPLFIMRGNRDFLLGQRFSELTGATLLEDPSVIICQQHRVLLSHGDAWCTDDLAYQRYRRKIRQPWRLALLRRLPLSFRQQLAEKLRQRSQRHKRDSTAQIMDVNPTALEQSWQQHAADYLIHGHTHRPRHHQHQIGSRLLSRWVIPDWYDNTGGYLAMDNGQITRYHMTISNDKKLLETLLPNKDC